MNTLTLGIMLLLGAAVGFRPSQPVWQVALAVVHVLAFHLGTLAWLGGLAHGVRTKINGDRVFFNVNRHLNLTNVCSASCAYCSFQRKPGEKAQWLREAANDLKTKFTDIKAVVYFNVKKRYDWRLDTDSARGAFKYLAKELRPD